MIEEQHPNNVRVIPRFIRTINHILNTGVDPENGIARNRQIRSVNIVGLTGGSVALVFSIVYAFQRNFLPFGINTITMACLFGMVICNKKKWYDLGPMITMPVCSLQLAAGALIYNNNMDLYLLLVICLSLILLNNKTVMLTLSIFSAILLMVSHRLAPHTVIHQAPESRRIINAVIWLFLLLFCMYYVRWQIMGYIKDLEESNQQLNISNKTREKLISILAHDMSSPISTLFFMLDLLQEEMLSGKDFATSSKLLIQQARNLQENMDGLLQWCYTQMKGIAPNPVQFDLHGLIADVTTFLQPQLQKKQISLETELGPAPYIIMADQEHIRLIIRNLLSNAIKFSYPDSIILLSLQDRKGKVILSVKDFGVGIPVAIQQTIFTPDHIHSTPGTKNEKGIGLGLSLSQEFAQKNNGFLTVESEEKKGSTFSLHLHK